jgi:dynein heavy chain
MPLAPAHTTLLWWPPKYAPIPSATPIFFILFPGYSPSKEIEAYARATGRSPEAGNLTLISMGQGQEGPAEAILNK